MGGEIYTVQRNDCAWKVSRKRLETNGKKATGAAIIKEMERLAKLNGCESVDEFNNKFFNKIGSKFICEKEQQVKTSEPQVVPAQNDNTFIARPDTTHYERNDTTTVVNPYKKVTVANIQKDSASVDSANQKPTKPISATDSFEAEAEHINSIKGNK